MWKEAKRLLRSEYGGFAALDRGRANPILSGTKTSSLRRAFGNETTKRRAAVLHHNSGPAMNDGDGAVTVRVHAAIAEIPAAAWDACAGDVNPSVSYAFLSALEDSGSTTPRTGWTPQHLSLAGPDGAIVGVVPLYAKTHSYGEYVFDYGWADAYERAGGRYYPKLLSAGAVHPGSGTAAAAAPRRAARGKAQLIAAMVELANRRRISSVHVNFPERGEAEALTEAGFLQRIGQQFHWTNEGYRDFEDYLAALNSRKRKAVKKERREAVAEGLEIEALTGRRSDDPPLGRVLPLLSGDLGPEMGLRPT